MGDLDDLSGGRSPTFRAVRLLRIATFVALVAAMTLTVPWLASNNLLPRRVALHVFSMGLIPLTVLRRRPSRHDPLLGALLAWGALTWLLSPVSSASIPGWLDFSAQVGILWGVARGGLPRRRLLQVVLSIAVVGAALGLLEGWLPLSLPSATRPAGLFASRATAGSLMAGTLPLLALVLPARRRVASVALAMCAAFLVTTRARAAWAGALVSLVWPGTGPSSRWRLATGLGVVLALAAPVGPLLRWNSASPYRDSLAFLTAEPLDGRIGVWPSTFALALRRPWGWGPGSFEAATHFTAGEGTVRVEAPHNEPLRLLFELGLPGAILLLGLVAGMSRRRASPRTRLLQASALALVVASLAGKTLLEPPTAVLLCVVAGLSLRRREPAPRPAPKWRTALAVALLGSIVVLAARADVAALLASRALASGKAAATEGHLRSAFELAHHAPEALHDLGAWLWVADLALEAGDPKACSSVVGKALVEFPAHPLLLSRQGQCGPR